MQQKVYNNVEAHRVLDGGVIIEDVTSITPPTISHPTTPISVAGMAGAVDMPDQNRLEAMEFSIAHNCGLNYGRLRTPGTHRIETRVVRQVYDAATQTMQNKSIKIFVNGVHKSSEPGNIEQGNPKGETDKYSVLRYEEFEDGVRTMLLDLMAGIVEYDGKDYASDVENLLK